MRKLNRLHESILKEATGAVWQKEIVKLSPSDKQKYAKAIDTLLSWDYFKQEWRGQGLETIKYYLEEK
jgi:hypothetical protein